MTWVVGLGAFIAGFGLGVSPPVRNGPLGEMGRGWWLVLVGGLFIVMAQVGDSWYYTGSLALTAVIWGTFGLFISLFVDV